MYIFSGGLFPVHAYLDLSIAHPCPMFIPTANFLFLCGTCTQSELVWRDLDSLLLRSFGIVLPLLVASIYGLAYNPSLLFVDGVILSRYFF